MSSFRIKGGVYLNSLEWLLEEENPSVRYRTLVELLDEDRQEKSLIRLKNSIAESEPVREIFSKMHPEGYWLQKNQQSGKVVGQDVEYGSFATTHFCLAYLAELGMDRSHPLIELASRRYLDLQKEDGDWWDHLSCLYGYNIRTFILLGYREDEKVQKAIDLMRNTNRKDGGYLCDLHEKANKRPQKSCIRGSAKTLLAFSQMPEYWKSERCFELVNYFLNRQGIYKNKNPEEYVNKDMTNQTFPIIWRTNVWEILYALGKMGYGNDPRLQRAWEVLDRTKDSSGKVYLDWTPSQCTWKVGKKGEANKWLTFYTLLEEKYRG